MRERSGAEPAKRLPIPAGPEELTAGWLSAALGEPASRAGGVSGFVIEPTPERAGFSSQVARVRLSYAGRPGGKAGRAAPTSVVAKFTARDPAFRARSVPMTLSEARFFRDVAAEHGALLGTPGAYHVDSDDETGQAVLLLEDLSGLRGGDDVAGCSFEDALPVVRHAARVHARFWDHRGLERLDWWPTPADDGATAAAGFRRAWEVFVPAFAHRAPPVVLRAGALLGERHAGVVDALAAASRTLIHGDYRLDHVFYTGDERTAVRVVDWQTAATGCGAFDLAYLLGWCLAASDRGGSEERLVAAYHGALLAEGIAGESYPYERCLREYRLAALVAFVRLVRAAGALTRSGGRGRRLFDAALRRCAAQLDAGVVDDLAR